MRFKAPVPPPDYPFVYANKPRSGNEVNGLGLREKVRPEQVFHNTGRGAGRQRIDWAALDMFFNLTNPWPMFWENLRGWWERRNAAGPVALRPAAVPADPAETSALVKTKAAEIGLDLVGITLFDEESQYAGRTWPYKYAICLGAAMNRAEMEYVPSKRAATEVMRTYRRSSQMANRLAKFIRSLGWQAEAFGIGEDIMLIPMAIRAGLGQLGKHGSMISKEHGSNFRLTVVLTDLPMALDGPVDSGVEDFCASCQVCTSACPPKAIFPEKQWVRGEQKWYVDFDKCIPYFTLTHGCAICIEVCPWSEPGRGFKIAEKMLARRPKSAGGPASATAERQLVGAGGAPQEGERA